MSTVRQDVLAYLAAQPGIQALLTADGKTRIFLSRIPQTNPPADSFPAVMFRRATGGHEHDLDGSAGIATPDFEFHVIDPSPTTVESVCEAIRQELQGFRGTMGGTTIQRCTLEDEQDFYHESQIGDDTGFHVTVLTYRITYLESIPTFA